MEAQRKNGPRGPRLQTGPGEACGGGREVWDEHYRKRKTVVSLKRHRSQRRGRYPKEKDDLESRPKGKKQVGGSRECWADRLSQDTARAGGGTESGHLLISTVVWSLG